MSIAFHLVGSGKEVWIDALRNQLPGRVVELPGNIADPLSVHYVVTWRHKPGAFNAYANLKAIFSLGAGVDHVFADPHLPAVAVVRAVNADLTERMSEWVMLHCLLHLRQQRMYDWQQSEKLWADDRRQPAASAVRVGLLGLGVLGSDAALKLKAIGFDVAGWSRTLKHIPGISSFDTGGLDAFLARTDILVCLLPSTPQTRGILNSALFAKLARDGRLGGPILLNAGRGTLQVEEDILVALDEGVLRAATLDVFEKEPLPKESALWHHPGITITPHNAAISDPDMISAAIARQILAFERGEPLANVVDPALQY